MKNLQTVLVLALVIILILGGGAIFLGFSQQKEQSNQINVTIDKTVIVQKIQNLSRLETVQTTIQRDLKVELNAGSLSFYGKDLLQDKATTDYAVTGLVTAGIDLSELKPENVKLENEGKKISLELPSPKILSIQIDEDKTKITSEDFTFLFNLKNLDPNRRKEMRDELQRQATKQAKEALRDGACSDQILEKASENAKESLKNLFLFSSVEEVVITFQGEPNCEFNLN
jgi:hypothetical protein